MITRQQLKHLRLTYGFSFREVAEASGGKISHTAISLLEKGERTLNPEMGEIILDTLYRLNEQRAAVRIKKEIKHDE